MNSDSNPDIERKRFIKLRNLLTQPSVGSFAAFIVLVTVFFRLTQPQTVLSFLAILRFQLLLGVISSIIWLTAWRDSLVGVAKYFAVFLVVTGGLVVLGKVWEPFIYNDRMAFYVWRDFALMGLSAVLPVVTLFPYGDRLRALCSGLGLSSLLIAAYAITHKGVGPGSWVRDENDVCFVLVMLLPFSLLLWKHIKKFSVKALLLLSIVMTFGGIVATNSRGGFVGLVCSLAYLFYRSPNKLKIIALGVIGGAIGVALVPVEYWTEMGSISEVSSGTAMHRRRFWMAALKLWLHPPHIIAGVGIANSSGRLGEMVGEATFYGRAVHSMYFQLLTELGVVGIVFFILMVGCCLWKNRQVGNYNRIVLSRLSQLNVKSMSDSKINELRVLKKELLFIESALCASNMSWIGLLGAGAFISVFYYPPLWICLGFSVALQRYAEKITECIKGGFYEASS